MVVVTPQQLIALQKLPDHIRNICILAHVDHGKTSLTDVLLATNNIISPKLASKVRFLDSRPDEQLRGITMESSAISLYFPIRRRNDQEQVVDEEYLINLIDSPGHIDFQSEVSTASRLCDGAIVLVDAVEGVCSQTVTVLRQTWVEKMKPVLLINKMDRLISELRMTPLEAHIHLNKLLEQINAVVGSFFQGERMEEDLRWREKMAERVSAAASSGKTQDRNITNDDSVDFDYEEIDDEDLYFAPEKGNVIFGSAVDGWAFTIKQFAAIYEKKLGIKRANLEKCLWGDFYFDTKTKRVIGPKHLKGRNLKPMFVQLVLDNIWAIYQATVGDASSATGDEELLGKIIKSLSINIKPHVLKSRDPIKILQEVFAQWLPMSTSVLVSVIEQLPSPQAAQESRMPALIESSPDSSAVDSDIVSAVSKFSPDIQTPIVVFVSKMIAIKESELPRNKRAKGSTLTAEEARELARKKRSELARIQAAESQRDSSSNLANELDSLNVDDENKEVEKDDPEHFIGYARIYSGTLTTGSEIYVLPPKYSPAHPEKAPAIKVKIEALYLLMGRSLETLDSVSAGTIFGVEGLQSALLKQGTLVSKPTGVPNLAGIASTQAAPILRVALEPEWPGDLEKMINGMKMLERSDPCAVYEALESGEHILGTAGELHLERCLKDLKERFAKCEIQAGEPIVSYREGIVNHPSVSGEISHGVRGTSIIEIGKGLIHIKLRVRPLPKPALKYLVGNSSAVKKIVDERKSQDAQYDDTKDEETTGDKLTGRVLSPSEFAAGLEKSFSQVKAERESWKGVVNKIVAFGPKRIGPNLLIDSTPNKLMGKSIFSPTSSGEELPASELADKITQAFQLAVIQGPLCHEPVQGTAIDILALSISSTSDNTNSDVDTDADPDPTTTSSSSSTITKHTSEVIRAVRTAIHTSFLEWSPRLYLAMYRCEIDASADALGRVYSVLTRRHAHILSEELREASNVYAITSLLPLHASFGFSDEMRKRTSGVAAAPQLVFHGFELLDQDPFWVPATEEEIEDLGDTADRENRAKVIVDRVRDRKGLLVLGRKLDAEKERNLKR